MRILEKLIIPPKDIKDIDWEDPQMNGWMTFFTVSLIFFSIFGIATALQRPFVPVWSKWLETSIYILPVYASIALMLRFRDAVFCTLMSLVMIIALYAASVFGFFITHTPLSHSYPSILILFLAISASLYFVCSKQVKSRFPFSERKAFWFDIIPIAFSFIIAFFVITNSIHHSIHNKEWNYSRLYQLDEILAKGISFKEHQSSFQLVSANTEKRSVILYFNINPYGIRPYSSAEVIHEISTEEASRNDIKKIFVENNRELMECLLEMDMSLTMIFFINNINDGTDIFIHHNEIKDLLAEKDLSIKKEEQDYHVISLYADSLNRCCPIVINPYLTLEGVECNEVKLNFRYILDEKKSSFADYEDIFLKYLDSLYTEMVKLDKSQVTPPSLSPEILNLMKPLEMDLTYTLTASKSRFTKDYTEWRLYGFSPSLKRQSSDNNPVISEDSLNLNQKHLNKEENEVTYRKV